MSCVPRDGIVQSPVSSARDVGERSRAFILEGDLKVPEYIGTLFVKGGDIPKV